MPSSRPTSSGGRRPPNATLSSNDAMNSNKRTNSAVNLSRDHQSSVASTSGTPSAAASAALQRRDSSDHHHHHHSEDAGGSGHNDEGGSNSGSSKRHHTSHKVGPKRKSKVGISGLAGDGNQSHFGAGHHLARKKNASSSGLARRDKSRSHLALTHVASELAALSQMQEAPPAMSTSRSGRSKERKSNKSPRPLEEETAPVVASPAPLEGDENENEGGWISATSSAAATPLAGTSPVSPESYKALEFGKKSRRKKASNNTTTTAHVQPLDFPKYEQRPHIQRTATEEEEILGTTPRQRESALSLAAPKNLASVSSLSQLADKLSTTNNNSISRTSDARDSGVVISNAQGDSSIDGQPATNTSASIPHTQPAESNDRINDLPQLPENYQRPTAMRKSSTSTIRSLVSVGGSRPLSASIRRQTLTPLQPRLDTSVEGHGQLKHVGLIPKQDDVAFPSEQLSNTARTHRRQHSGASLGAGPSSKAGTLTPQEAEELAKRLRTVSGSDIPASSASGSEPDFGQHPIRGTLRRSASTAQGSTLASLQKYGISSPRNEQPPSANNTSGALGTLKRASGYFGSISRLTSLGSTLGLTSLDRDNSNNNNSGPSPSSPGYRRTPSSAGSMAAAQSSTSPMQRLQGAYGLRGSRNTTTPQVRQPLISKFIDPSESYQPFPKASTSPSTTTTTTTTSSQSRHPGMQRGATSRARQKLLTQRDYPDEYEIQHQLLESGNTGSGSGIPSDEDPMASQVNLRKNLSSKNLSGTSTPLQPGVQRWLVALSKEAERIDKEHETFFRFHDTMQLSFARILERRALEEQEEIRAWKERNQKG